MFTLAVVLTFVVGCVVLAAVNAKSQSVAEDTAELLRSMHPVENRGGPKRDELLRNFSTETWVRELRANRPAPSDYERHFSEGPVGRWYPWFDGDMGTGFTGVAMQFGLMGGTCEFHADGTGTVEEWRGDRQDFEWRSTGHCRIEVTMMFDDFDEEEPDLVMETSYGFDYSRGELQVCLRVKDGGDPFFWASAPWYLEAGEEEITRQSRPRPLRIR